MIYAQSRYAEVEQGFVVDSSGQPRKALGVPRFYGTEFGARKHIVEQDERLDQIAAAYYGDPESWWVIAVANPELFYPERIEAGTLIRIPDDSPVL